MKQDSLGRWVVPLLAAVLALAVGLSACRHDDASPERTKVRLSEVTHSVFYAPQYAAMELGYFAEAGIELELTSGEGADKVMTGVISGAIDIGFSGPEAAIYAYNEGKADFAKVFAQVTARDGSFLLGREPEPDFDWADLAGSHVLPGRKGGVPYMALEYVLKSAGLDPDADLLMDNSIQFSAMTGAFLGGTGDYVTVFEPTASTIVAEGRGYILAAVGETAGEIPYTAYYALGSYMEKNAGLIGRFTEAVYKGQQYVAEHSAEEIAALIAPQFPDADLTIMTQAIQNYKDIGAYAETPVMSEEAFERLQTVMASAGELAKPAPYEDLVDNSFALAAVK